MLGDRPAARVKPGFTLIELLAVVAILAILAAIAIPNLLEAQVRAKVSAAWSEMRTLAVALEAYSVDANHYPPDFSASGRDPGLRSYLLRLVRLTTPIAYLASVPEDPFAKTISDGDSPYDDAYRVPFETGPFVRPFPFDYAAKDPDSPADAPEIWERISSRPSQAQWALRSIGPSRQVSWLGDGMPAYDPSNGTVSRGHLYFTGPGIGKDQPRNAEF